VTVPYQTVDVFTDRHFGGNPLAVIPDATTITEDDLQRIAAEFNYSETTFVLPPTDPANTARVRIFTTEAELPFAGHPNVGTAFVLAEMGRSMRTADGREVLRFEEGAGLVEIEVTRDAAGAIVATTFTAPQPFTRGGEVAAADVAACLGLPVDAVVVDRHVPVQGSVGLTFTLAELRSLDDLAAIRPVIAEMERCDKRYPSPERLFAILAYVRTPGRSDGVDVRCRMFSFGAFVGEDPATGSANGALIGLLASLDGRSDGEVRVRSGQGFEMGRPSILELAADLRDGAVAAVRVGGRSVPMMRGELLLGG